MRQQLWIPAFAVASLKRGNLCKINRAEPSGAAARGSLLVFLPALKLRAYYAFTLTVDHKASVEDVVVRR